MKRILLTIGVLVALGGSATAVGLQSTPSQLQPAINIQGGTGDLQDSNYQLQPAIPLNYVQVPNPNGIGVNEYAPAKCVVPMTVAYCNSINSSF